MDLGIDSDEEQCLLSKWQEYIDQLRTNEEKKDVLSEYTNVVGTI